MFGIRDLKRSIEITDTTVECPVAGCSEQVPRQRKSFRREEKFRCHRHDIYISPSTFEYGSELDNILWKERDDLRLFHRLKSVKRESRLSRDNSEDAVSWNVFRFLERNSIVSDFMERSLAVTAMNPEIIYWSYSQSQNDLWDELRKARIEFELVPSKGSEPDIIIICDGMLAMIEAKLTASNETKPSKLYVERKYTSGGQKWWNEVFHSDFMSVAVRSRKYELSRFWLLGTWIADQLGLDFCLINLVRSEREKHIETVFGKHIKNDKKKKFLRIAWEDIYRYVIDNGILGDSRILISYFNNKTVGYRNGELQRAFDVRPIL